MNWARGEIAARLFYFADIHQALLSRAFFGEAALDGWAGEFAESVGGDPAGSGRIESADLFGGANCCAVQRLIAFADIAERPVHGFFYEVAIVAGFALNDGERAKKFCVGRSLVFVRKIGDQRKACALDEFFLAARPLDGFFPCGRGVNE